MVIYLLIGLIWASFGVYKQIGYFELFCKNNPFKLFICIFYSIINAILWPIGVGISVYLTIKLMLLKSDTNPDNN